MTWIAGKPGIAGSLGLAAATAALSLVVLASPASAANCGNDKDVGNAQDCKDKDDKTSFSATPELDSVVLFGAGLTGLGGYALMRLRARRRE